LTLKAGRGFRRFIKWSIFRSSPPKNNEKSKRRKTAAAVRCSAWGVILPFFCAGASNNGIDRACLIQGESTGRFGDKVAAVRKKPLAQALRRYVR